MLFHLFSFCPYELLKFTTYRKRHYLRSCMCLHICIIVEKHPVFRFSLNSGLISGSGAQRKQDFCFDSAPVSRFDFILPDDGIGRRNQSSITRYPSTIVPFIKGFSFSYTVITPSFSIQIYANIKCSAVTAPLSSVCTIYR